MSTTIKRNTASMEQQGQEGIDNILNQLPMQLDQIANNKKVEAIEIHFKYILAQDIYKNALTEEQITEIESYLPENYQDDYI
jgi:predicted alternative tryptophan synthase beta-subunit